MTEVVKIARTLRKNRELWLHPEHAKDMAMDLQKAGYVVASITSSEQLTEQQAEYLDKLRAASNELRVYGEEAIKDLQDALELIKEDSETWPGPPEAGAWGKAYRAGVQLDALCGVSRQFFPVLGSDPERGLRKKFNAALAGQDWRKA
jgi:hypothetical protein